MKDCIIYSLYNSVPLARGSRGLFYIDIIKKEAR